MEGFSSASRDLLGDESGLVGGDPPSLVPNRQLPVLTRMEYSDFVIQFGFVGSEKLAANVICSPAGEGSELFSPSFDPKELCSASFLSTGLPLQEVGSRLFQSLFLGQVRNLYERSLGIVKSSKNHGLRIRIRLNPGVSGLLDIYRIPWELMHTPGESGSFLCLNRYTPIVRYLDVPQERTPILAPRQLRMLVACANPPGTAPLDAEYESSEIEKNWRDSSLAKVSFLNKTSLPSLRKATTEGEIHIVHFICHGYFSESDGEGYLLLEDESGYAVPVSGQALATTLRDTTSLRLVFLSACESALTVAQPTSNPFAGVATAIVQAGIPAVVAMQFPISDQAAIAFSKKFYRQIVKGDPVDTAMVEGRHAIYGDRPGAFEWCTPVLLMRSVDGSLFRYNEKTHDGEEAKKHLQDGLRHLAQSSFSRACQSFEEALSLQPNLEKAVLFHCVSEMAKQPLCKISSERAIEINDHLCRLAKSNNTRISRMANLILGILRLDYYDRKGLRYKGLESDELFNQLEKSRYSDEETETAMKTKPSPTATCLFNLKRR